MATVIVGTLIYCALRIAYESKIIMKPQL